MDAAAAANVAAVGDQATVTGQNFPAIDLMVDARVIDAATSEVIQASTRAAAIVASRIVLEVVREWVRSIATGHRSARIEAKDVIEVLTKIGDLLAAVGAPDGMRVRPTREGGA